GHRTRRSPPGWATALLARGSGGGVRPGPAPCDGSTPPTRGTITLQPGWVYRQETFLWVAGPGDRPVPGEDRQREERRETDRPDPRRRRRQYDLDGAGPALRARRDRHGVRQGGSGRLRARSAEARVPDELGRGGRGDVHREERRRLDGVLG